MNLTLIASCVLALASTQPQDALPLGSWRAWLESPGGPLPFGMEFLPSSEGLEVYVLNGEERLRIPEVRREDGAIVLSMPHYDSLIRAKVEEDGQRLEGTWSKVSGPNKKASLVFRARHGVHPRFIPPKASIESKPEKLRGKWRVLFDSSSDPAVATFDVNEKGRVTATFLTTTGDYRFLEGDFLGTRLRLSCFDGAHAFLFLAELKEDGSLSGDFWSRDSWHETWTATRDPDANLADPFEEVTWNDDVALSDLRFPDLDGELRSLDDPAFGGKARIIQVFGSWCPNCHDETAYLVELDRKYRDKGLSILGIAFELTGQFERDAKQVKTFMEHHRVRYPILLAGQADKKKATETFRALSRIKSYPTTIFIDRRGGVRAIHSGFTGPATGEAWTALRRDFEARIEALLEDAS